MVDDTRRPGRGARPVAAVLGVLVALALLATSTPTGAAGLDLEKRFGQRFVGSASAPQSVTVPLTTPTGAVRNAVLAEIDRTSFPAVKDPLFGTTLISGSQVRSAVRAAFLGLDATDTFAYRVDGYAHPLPADFPIGGTCLGADGMRTTVCTMTVTFRPTAAGPRVDPIRMEITITGGLNVVGDAIDDLLGDWGFGSTVTRLLSPLLDPIVQGVVGTAIEDTLLDPVVTASGTGVAGPFTDPAVFVRRQHADFGAGTPSPATVQDWLRRFESGESPAVLVDSLRRGQQWDGAVGPVVRLYTAYYRRSPETGGLAYWLDRRATGTGLHRMAQIFSETPEFRTLYGRLSDAEFVRLVYRNVLGRDAEPTGFTYWTEQLGAGMTRGRMMLGFSESPEYVQRTGPTVTTVELWFGMLRRAPSSTEVATTAGRLSSGTTVTTVVLELLASPEYRAVVLG